MVKAVDTQEIKIEAPTGDSFKQSNPHKDRLRVAMKVLLRHIASDMQRFLNPKPLGEVNNTRHEGAINVLPDGSLPSPHKERNP
jgi:hypothetical protein